MASNYRRLFMQRRQLMALAVLAAAIAAPAFSQSKEVKIAVIASKTGPLEAYAKQTIVGFNMGLDYATGGTMMVAGKKLVVIEKDDQGKPDVGKAALAAAYGDDKADIAVGPHRLAGGSCHAASGRGIQEGPAGRAGGGRLDHR
jgi:branched-chain amino acid transport system substrate-binding protein